MNELRVFLKQSPRIHIIALTETLLNCIIWDAEVSLPGYTCSTLFRRDRLEFKGGGVAVCVSESINAVRRSDLEIDESVWIEIFLPKSKGILFGTFYRPPLESVSQSDLDFMDRFYYSLDWAAAEGKVIIVNGDFNCDYLPKKPSPETKNVLKKTLRHAGKAISFYYMILIKLIAVQKALGFIDPIFAPY